MLDITTFKNDNNYDAFCIHTNEGKFYITFENNLDLYWWYRPNKSILECDDTKEFTITKENSFLYDAFDELYKAIKFSMPYRNAPYNTDCKYKKVKRYFNDDESLFKNGVIEWHSDDFQYELASVLSIIKLENNKFKIIFKKSVDKTYLTFSVRFRNSGSGYDPFNIPFMSFYSKLKEYDFDYHQISIDEYLYNNKQKKLVR